MTRHIVWFVAEEPAEVKAQLPSVLNPLVNHLCVAVCGLHSIWCQ